MYYSTCTFEADGLDIKFYYEVRERRRHMHLSRKQLLFGTTTLGETAENIYESMKRVGRDGV